MKPRIPIGIDLETYYDGEYSLRKMSTVEYCRDSRFELHLASVVAPSMWTDAEPRTFVGANEFQGLCDHLKSMQGDYEFVLVGNNSAFFDALVIKERFGLYFRSHWDAMTNAGWVYGNRLKNRKLETIVQHMNLQPDERRRAEALAALGIADDGNTRKISQALSAVKGLRLDTIQQNLGLMKAYTLYCEQDVIYSWQIYKRLAPLLTQDTLDIADFYYRAYLDMPLEVDVPLLSTLKDDYQQERADAIEAFGLSLPEGVKWEGMKTIRSKDKFAQLLVDIGAPPPMIPMKPGKDDKDGNPRMIYAFDKQSMALDNLAAEFDDGESLVPLACELRLEYNSSATESKLVRFAAAGKTGPWAFSVKPYGAANTSRHSGTNSTGASGQNLKKAKKCFYPQSCKIPVRFAEKTGVRDAIGVPEGYELAVGDLNAIELRTCMTFCNDREAMAILADPKRDLYVEDGRVYFDKPDMTKADDVLRQAAKVTDLSAQYLVGWRRILHQARLWKVPMDAHLAQLCHATYRQRHVPVVDMWGVLEEFMEQLEGKSSEAFQIGPVGFDKDGIHLPNGFLLRYPAIESYWRKVGRTSMRAYKYFNASKSSYVHVHAGMLMENISQGLAACVMNYIHPRLYPALEPLGGVFCTTVHDEFLWRFPVGNGKQGLSLMLEEMARPIPWWPELTTRGEGDSGFGILEHAGTFSVVSRYGMLK